MKNTDPIPSMRRRLATQSNERCRRAMANYILWSAIRVLIRNREGAREVRDERIDLLLGVKPEGLSGRIRIECWCADERVVGVVAEIADILASLAESPPRLTELLARAKAPDCARLGSFIPYRIDLASSLPDGGALRCLLDDPWQPEVESPGQYRTSELLVLLARCANGVSSSIHAPAIARLNAVDRRVIQWAGFVARGWSPRIAFECVSIEARNPEEWRMSGAEMQFI
jgi:hypothetical protein